MSTYRKNMISGLIFLALGVILLVVIPASVDKGEMSAVGPRAFPYFIAVGMILLSLVLMAASWWEERKTHGGARPVGPSAEAGEAFSAKAGKAALKDEGRAYALVGILLLYVFTFDKIGYFLSTFAASTLILALFRVKKVRFYFIVYACTTAIYLAFTKLLLVMLP